MALRDNIVPEKIFIVPYRDREPHKMAFVRVMMHILENVNYKILFIHQNDRRSFNRGAMKNIGFLYIKEKWPNNWKNITLIFHDIDYIASCKDQFSFNTNTRKVKHFLGYKNTLGGIFAIKANDFSITKGFPNIWTWGWEDNIFYNRVKKAGLGIDYSEFLEASTNIESVICLWHGWDRKINTKQSIQRQSYSNNNISSIINLGYNIQELEKNILMINVNTFNIINSLHPNKSHISKINARLYDKQSRISLGKSNVKNNKFGKYKQLF